MLKIIGGSGFVGTRLCKRLQQHEQPFRIIDKQTSTTFSDICDKADVRDLDTLQTCLEKGDTIINLAAEHRDDVSPRSLYDEVNVQGARHVCQVAEEKGINTIIFTSSVAVYGIAPLDTDENGAINYFNDYGRTKYEAEQVYKQWQEKDPNNRKLVIIRPTVIFGEQNRGNVYNLLNFIASGKFIMIGNGQNRKSMAYVENVTAFIEKTLEFDKGQYTYNYIDKPDFDMNSLVRLLNKTLGKGDKVGLRLPYALGYSIGKCFDGLAAITGKKFPISSVRIKKFCGNTAFATSVSETGFEPPISLEEGLRRTVNHEFLESHDDEVFYTE